MARLRQQPGTRGSQFRLQRMVNDSADPLGTLLRREQVVAADETITWLSPLENDDLAEYRDEAFLTRLGLHSSRMDVPLAQFWPTRGPQWDALGWTSRRRALLLEGKSHRAELITHCKASSAESLARIRRALSQTRVYCRGDEDANWLDRHYQYANRLAHLYWLRQLNGIDANLVFVYFVNDRTVKGALSEEGWRAEISKMHRSLGLSDSPFQGFVHHIFVDADALDEIYE